MSSHRLRLIGRLVADHGFDRFDAYRLLTHPGRMRVGNIVDPQSSLGAGIDEGYIP